MDGSQVSCSDLRLHITCGTNPLPGWMEPDRAPRPPGVLADIDPTAMPLPDASVTAIMAEHLLERLGFAEERMVWQEFARVLRPGGELTIEVPDFEWLCRRFVSATDDWRDFYVVAERDHDARCGTALDQRWGFLQTIFFGRQHGPYQFHKSAYTAGKIRALARQFHFAAVSLEPRLNNGGRSLRAVLTR